MKKRNYWNEYLIQNFINEDTEDFKLQPFSKVATQYIKQDAPIQIAVGSIRSGKTIAAIIKFLLFIKQSPYNDFALAGKTLGSLNTNVVKPMKRIMKVLGIKFHQHNSEYQSVIEILNFKGSKNITLYGIEKKGAEEKIKGSTFAGAFLDEVTVMDEEGVKMLISRCSLDGARVFMTCNPVSPNNFINLEYVSNDELISSGEVSVTKFLIEDNHTLSPEYIKRMKSIYPEESIFYKRNILGLWASGQGLIYSRFTDENIYNEDKPLHYYDYLEIGSDYGASSTTCWNLIGIKYLDDHLEYDVIDEGGFNAEKEGYSLTDKEIVDRIIETQNKYQLGDDNIFYPSHDATSLEAELEKNPMVHMSIRKFTPDTNKCIGEISSLFYQNYLRVHERCKETIKCIYGYEWDTNAAKKGEDKPLKVDDHYCDSIRAPIMNHLIDDMVDLSEIVYV